MKTHENLSMFTNIWHNSEVCCILWWILKDTLFIQNGGSHHFSQKNPLCQFSILQEPRVSAWWITPSVSSKNKALGWQVHHTLQDAFHRRQISAGTKTCQQAIGSNSLSMMRRLEWFRTFSFSSNLTLRLKIFGNKNLRCHIVSLSGCRLQGKKLVWHLRYMQFFREKFVGLALISFWQPSFMFK